MVHLCNKHQDEYDQTDGSVRQARIRTHQALPEGRKMHCVQCQSLLNYPLFMLCSDCARTERLCQRCSTSTLTPEERV